ENCCFLDPPDDLALRARSHQLHPGLEIEILDLPSQVGFQLSGAGDRTGEATPTAGQEGTRIDKVGEALLLHQPPHGNDPRRPVVRRPVREAIQVEAVIAPLYA